MTRVKTGKGAQGTIVEPVKPITIIDAVKHGEIYEVEDVLDNRAPGTVESDLAFIMSRADSIVDNVTVCRWPLPPSGEGSRPAANCFSSSR